MSAPVIKLLGDNLVSPKGDAITTTAHVGSAKYVGLYFSAHWCPPCRGFTPQLSNFYTTDLKARGLEIVFISSDRDEEAFKEYAGEQPWAALPFGDRARKAKLSTKYGVQGIPTLVILDAVTGDLITKDGRSSVMKDPKGQNLPWTPPNALNIVKKAGIVDSHLNKADLPAADVVGLYFSAHWCGPCKNFTPKLAALYSKLKAADDKAGRAQQRLAVVFVSADRDAKSFEHYLGTMSWHALPEHSGEANDELNGLFGVEGIPTLVLLDGKSGKLLSDDGTSAVMTDPDGVDFPWLPKPVNVLSQATAGLVKGPSVVVFCGDDAEARAKQTELEKAVVAWRSEQGGIAGADDVDFFTAGSSDPVVVRVKQLLGEANAKASHLVLDLGSGGCFVPPKALQAGAVSVDDVKALLVDYLASKIPASPLVRGG